MIGFIRAFARPSNLIATGAVVLALAGTATAGALLTGGDIKNGSVTSADVKNNNLKSKDVKNGTLKTKDLSAKAKQALQGQQGPPGQQGQQGEQGPVGPSETQVLSIPEKSIQAEADELVDEFQLPAGSYLVTVKFTAENGIPNGGVDCTLAFVEPSNNLEIPIDKATDETMDAGEFEQFVMHAAFTREASTYRVTCDRLNNQGLTLNNVYITVTKVGTVSAL